MVDIKMINPKDKAIVLEFKKRIPAAIRSHLHKLIVFGSRAKGNATEDSDLDLIALVDHKDSQIEKELDDIAYQVMCDHDFRPMISLKIFAEGQFYSAVQKGFSFYQHVHQDGVAI